MDFLLKSAEFTGVLTVRRTVWDVFFTVGVSFFTVGFCRTVLLGVGRHTSGLKPAFFVGL